MRNRTEQVTTTLQDSDNEEEEQFDDSEDDWKPAKKGTKIAGKRKPVPTSSQTSKKKAKQESDDSDEDNEEDEDDEDDIDEESENDDDDDDDDEDESAKIVARQATKRSGATGKHQPDKDGFMDLYLFKNDLTKNYRNDDKLCMWRRDGASLLQKFLLIKNDNENELLFKGSSVYSCWEEKRKNDFFQIRVQYVGDRKDSRVKVVNFKEFDDYANEDRPKVDLTAKAADSTLNNDEE